MTITQSTRFSYDELATSLSKSIGTQQQQSQTLGDDSIMYQILNEPIDDLFVENVCVSLIENDLIRGNVLSRARTLVLSKKEPFTDIPMVFKRKFGVNSSENWMN